MPDAALRTLLVQQLLEAHCPEWRADAAKRRFLSERLAVPAPMLAQAEALWGKVCRDELLQCTALLAAGRCMQAHELLVASVAPAMYLAGRHEELAELLLEMEPAAEAEAPAEWRGGGAMYLGYLALLAAQGDGSVAARASALLPLLRAASERLTAGEEALALAGGGSDPGGSSRRLLLRQRLVFSQMAQTLYGIVMDEAAQPDGGDRTAAASRLASMQAVLSLNCLPSELRMTGVTAAVCSAMQGC